MAGDVIDGDAGKRADWQELTCSGTCCASGIRSALRLKAQGEIFAPVGDPERSPC
jgi:hypothetical protein